MDTGFRLGEGKNPVASFLILLGILILSLVAGAMIQGGILALMPNSWHLNMALSGAEAMRGKDRIVLLLIQMLDAGMLFLVAPFLYITLYERKPLGTYSPQPIRDRLELIWPVLLIPAFMPLMEVIIEWNKTLDLPASLQAAENWMKNMEEKATQITESLTNFGSFSEFLLGVIVIALLPGIGEELLFRGTIQPLMRRIFGNWHVAIWVTAILFSAIHLQFYGFFPRMLLGALFGYLYWWSGNICVPVLGHFANNFITILFLYLNKQGVTNLDPEKMPDIPVPMVLATSAIGGLVMWRFRDRYFVMNNE